MNDLDIDFEDVSVPTPVRLPAKPLLEPVPDCPGEYILRLDNSALEKLDGCARAGQFYLVNRRQGIAGAALAFGGALHLALEKRYKGHAHRECVDAALERYRPTILRPDEWRTCDFLEYTLNYYNRFYNFVDFEPMKGEDGEPLVEIPFSLPLGVLEVNAELPYTYSELQMTNAAEDRANFVQLNQSNVYVKRLHILWSGKIDLAVYHNGPAIVDHKTTSIEGPSFYDSFFLSQPVHGYAWAMEQILHQPVRTFILNAIIIRKPTKSGTSNNCVRKPYPITQENIDDFVRDVMAKIGDFVHRLTTGFFPKSPFHCQNKYGTCPYFSVCTVDAVSRPVMLATDNYENVTWSPLTDS